MSDLALSALISVPDINQAVFRFGTARAIWTVLKDVVVFRMRAFRESTQNSVLALAANTCRQAEETPQSACSVPDSWAKYISSMIDSIREAVQDAGYLVPEEVRGRRRATGCHRDAAAVWATSVLVACDDGAHQGDCSGQNRFGRFLG